MRLNVDMCLQVYCNYHGGTRAGATTPAVVSAARASLTSSAAGTAAPPFFTCLVG